VPAFAAAAALAVAGCGGGGSSTTGAAGDAPAPAPERNFSETSPAAKAKEGHRNAENPPTGKPKKGAPKEYRVSAELKVELGKDVVYSLEPMSNKCVNDKREGPYGPTTSNPDTSELWMYASESIIPACFSLLSYQRWDFHETSPRQGHFLINLGQDCNGCSYHTKCEEWYLNSLHCETPSQLAIKITP
jgi:hypothetical protein